MRRLGEFSRCSPIPLLVPVMLEITLADTKPGEEGENELPEKRTTRATEELEKSFAVRANPVLLSAFKIVEAGE